MKIPVYNASQPASLTNAILIYSDQSKPVFASLHNISNVGCDDKPNLQVMPGSPVSKDGLLTLLGGLSERFSTNTDLLPENILAFSLKHLLWWLPAGSRRVHFDCKELGKRSAVVPHPALIFAVMQGGWYVWAMKESVRPTLTTPICHSPYFNVDDSGRICTGSANVPDDISPSTIHNWEKAFFDSAFTHTNGKVKKVALKDGEYGFWKRMLDGEYKSFPTKLLVPHKSKLADVMIKIRNNTGN